MAAEFKVDLADLTQWALAITGHGEHLAAAHVTADGRIATAELGWKGRSGAALSGRAPVWSARSTALVTRIGEHATAMHSSAHGFAADEIDASADMDELNPG